jgi:hypothetical protein
VTRSDALVDVLDGRGGVVLRAGVLDYARLTDYAPHPPAAFVAPDAWLGELLMMRKGWLHSHRMDELHGVAGRGFSC